VLPRASVATASQVHVPLTGAGARLPVQPRRRSVIGVEPGVPGPIQRSSTPAIADSSVTDTTIGRPASRGQTSDVVALTSETTGGCSTDAVTVTAAVPSALLRSVTDRAIEPSASGPRSMATRTSTVPPGARFPDVVDQMNGKASPSIDHDSACPPVLARDNRARGAVGPRSIVPDDSTSAPGGGGTVVVVVTGGDVVGTTTTGVVVVVVVDASGTVVEVVDGVVVEVIDVPSGLFDVVDVDAPATAAGSPSAPPEPATADGGVPAGPAAAVVVGAWSSTTAAAYQAPPARSSRMVAKIASSTVRRAQRTRRGKPPGASNRGAPAPVVDDGPNPSLATLFSTRSRRSGGATNAGAAANSGTTARRRLVALDASRVDERVEWRAHLSQPRHV